MAKATKKGPTKAEIKATEKKAKAVAEKKAAAEAKAADKAKAETTKAQAKEAALVALPIIAREINERFDLATTLDGKADDHRLSAALNLAKAEQECKSAGIDFKHWAEKNVKQSVETIRKMLSIGKSDNPKQALTDMRSKNKAANKKARDKKKAELVSRDTANAPKITANPVQVAQAAIAALPEKGQLEIGRKAVEGQGFKVVSATEAKVLEDVKAGAGARPVATFETLKTGFGTLKASEKVAFVNWAAEQIGVKIDTSAIKAAQKPADDLEDVLPASMRRAKVA